MMPEIRKDYVTDTWVIISTVRSSRPGDFKDLGKKTPPEKCPFCYGNEHMTPPEVLAYRKHGPPNSSGWWIRCVPNLSPALQIEGAGHRRVNQRYYESTGGTCIYCEIVETELEEEKRIVAEDESFVALSPYAARFPFETWILPKAHEMAFEDITDSERAPLARMMKDVLGRLYQFLEDPPYNYYIHTAPCDRKETKYHWHLEITPRLTETAGFERGTGFYINPVMPEDAAAILRGTAGLVEKPH